MKNLVSLIALVDFSSPDFGKKKKGEVFKVRRKFYKLLIDRGVAELKFKRRKK